MDPETVVIRRDTLYFDDGNIVLAANLSDNVGSVVFRAHKSVMAAHSPVFADMFSLPNAGTAAETYDGVPLIRMPDPAEDLQKFLEALYCKPPFSLLPFSPQTPSVARPVLALSTKYEVTHLRQLIVKRLEADWPQTLGKWDELEDMAAARRRDFLRHPQPPFVDDLFPEPVSALRLAHDFDIPTILPAIFYHLMRIPTKDDRDLTCFSNLRTARWDGRRTARWDLLRAEELLRVLRGRDEALRVFQDLLVHLDSYLNHPDNEICVKHGDERRLSIFTTCGVVLDSRKSHEDLLSLFRPATWDEREKEPRMCSDCEFEFGYKFDRLRSAFWERLPKIFGLAKQTTEAGA